ncbi:NUDIX domain-containing protein [Patescibacteria group bacterium]|nr:NUDIX domain-containing protein [Patescibacteria group bacterium]
MNNLYDYIKDEISSDICSENVGKYFFKRLEEGKITRDENLTSHFCLYFLPYNPATKQVFIVHHKKSGLWLTPGGHIDKGENLTQALNREIQEELGVENQIKEKIKPFLLTITPINNPVQPCKEHLDIWYRFPTDGSEFNVDLKEFIDTKWLGINEARKLITDASNLQALDKMQKLSEFVEV